MTTENILKLMKDKQVEFLDLRFTDPKGKASTPHNGCWRCR